MTDIMFRFLEQSLIMSVAILLVMILEKALGDKVRPAKRHMCCVIIFIALLIPFRPDVFSLPTSAPETQWVATSYANEVNPGPWRGMAFTQTQELMQSWNHFRTEPVPVFSRDASYLTYPTENNIAASNYPYSAIANSVFAVIGAITSSISIHQLLYGIWVVGAVIFLAVSVIRYMRFVTALKRHSLHIQDGPAYEILCRTRRSLGLRRKIRLWSNPTVTVPVMFGLLRPTIILPEYETHIDENKLDLFILHEALHIKRWDLATKFLCLSALTLHWFNPLAYWLNRHANEECERACDEAVIAYMGTENRLNYSLTLLFAAKQSHGYKKATMTLALTSDGKKLKNRLVNIMNNVTPKRWVLFICTALLLMVVMTFSLVSCGRSEAQPDEVPIWTPPPDDPNPFYGQTLTLAAPFSLQGDGHDLRVVNAYRRYRPGVSIETVDLDVIAGREQMSVQLMSGTAPLLISSIFVDVYNPSVARFFADWFPLINATPSFDQDKYFMNVFHGSAINGRLYSFPVAFQFLATTANNNIPGLAEALEGLDAVSFAQMMEFRRQFPTEDQLYFEPSFDVVIGVMENMRSFFNMETRMVDFDNQYFVDFLNYSRDLTSTNQVSGQFLGQWFFSAWPGPDEDAAWGQRYYFLNVHPGMLQYFMDFEEDLNFSSVTPLVNQQGEVFIETWGYVLNAQATPIQRALALDFMQFMTSEENSAVAGRPPYGSVNRDLQRIALGQLLSFSLNQFRGFGWRPTGGGALESIRDHYSAIADMPMTTGRIPRAIQTIISDALADFHFGLVTAEQTAQDLQNRITLFMMEME